LTDQFNSIAFLRKQGYIRDCPGINQPVLMDTPLVETMLSELNAASGGSLNKYEFQRLLQASNVVLPSHFSKSDLRETVDHLSRKEMEDGTAGITLKGFLKSRSLIIPYREDGDPELSGFETYYGNTAKWCLVAPVTEVYETVKEAVKAHFNKQELNVIPSRKFKERLRKENIHILERFEQAFEKAGRGRTSAEPSMDETMTDGRSSNVEAHESGKRVNVTPELQAIAAKLNIANGQIAYDDGLKRTVIRGSSGTAYADQLNPTAMRVDVLAQSVRQFSAHKRRLKFMRLLRDDGVGGAFGLDRDPTADEAASVRKVIGLTKHRNVSEEQKEALRAQLSKVRPQKDRASENVLCEA
jgi:hypothetical protein